MTDTPRTVPQLIEALNDENWRARRSAAKALGKMGSEAKQAIAHLIEALKDEQTSVRWAAAKALETMGPGAKEAVPALQVLLGDALSKQAATDALKKIAPEEFGD